MQFNQRTADRCKEETGKIFNLEFIAKVFSNSRIEMYGGEYVGIENKSPEPLMITDISGNYFSMDSGFNFHVKNNKLVPDTGSYLNLIYANPGKITWLRWYGNKEYEDCYMDGMAGHYLLNTIKNLDVRLDTDTVKENQKIQVQITDLTFN